MLLVRDEYVVVSLNYDAIDQKTVVVCDCA